MFMETMLDWMYPVRRSATEEIADVLGGFTAMTDRLNAAIAQGENEIADSTARVNFAWNTFLEVRDNEMAEQDDIAAALVKAERARDNIAALVGE